MGDYREVIHERLYVRVPGTDRLRKTAAGRLKRLVAAGWRETERWRRGDYLEVRLERTGVPPLRARLPRGGVEQRFERRPRGQERGPARS